MRKICLASASALVLAAASLSACVAPSDIQSSGGAMPGRPGWYVERQAPVYVPPQSLGASLDLGPIDDNPPPVRMQADAEPQQEAATVEPPDLNSQTAHDLEDAAGGYIIGRQAEHLIKQTIQRRRMAAAAKNAAEVGAGAAMTRAASGGRAATALEGGAAAGEGEEGAAVAGRAIGGALRGGAAAGEALGGEAVVEGGLALGAGDVLLGAAIVTAGVVGAYELYQSFQHHTEPAR